MDALDLLDAIQVHAAAAAITAGGSKFVDVAVGFPAAKGRCVRVFYAGEREVEHFESDKTLNSQLVAQAFVVRGYWPLSETDKVRQRVIEGEMAGFVKSLRTRILGDSQLGGEGADLNMGPAQSEQVVVGSTKYAITDNEIVVDYDEFSIAP